MPELKIMSNVDRLFGFRLKTDLNVLGLNPEKIRANTMRKVGQETTKRNLQGVICGGEI